MSATLSKGRRVPQRDKEPKNHSAEEQQYFSRAVAKSLELLEILGKSDQPLALNQLFTKVKLTKSSAFRLLYTLEATGYIAKHEDGHYSLKHEIRGNVREKLISTLLEIATPLMRELTREFRETTGLAVLFENHIEAIAVVESPHVVRMGNTVGRILQPHASALGKCITAWQPEQRCESLLRSYGVNAVTPHTIVDENELQREFERIRKQGYATDREETCAEGFCFSTPIFNADGEVSAAISISIPKMRLGPPEAQERIIHRMKETAAIITRALRR
jgi:DNA-binding IclR family transcriptional regulator